MIKSVTKKHYYQFGSFSLDHANRELLRDGQHIALTQKCFEILHFLIKKRTKILKKEEILKAVWTETFVEEANLAQHIYMLRKVLKENGGELNYIETIPKYGYRFVGEITESDSDSAAIHSTLPKLNMSDNCFENNGSNVDGIKQNDISTIMPAESESNNSPSSIVKMKRSLIIPNIVFASIFAIIIFAFLSLVISSQKPKKADIASVKSISILPFEQIGGGKDEKLQLGLADTLISRLSNQDKISVSPTSSIVNYSNSKADNSIEIGKKLKVDAVLTGTIQRENGFVRVNVQLISIHTKVPLWSDKFDVEFSNIFSLQDKISMHLAKKLSIKLDDSPQFALDAAYTPNEEAKEEFEKGLIFWEKRTRTNLPKAAEHFEKAIAIDSKFAIAYAHLADTYSLIGYYKINEFMPPETAIHKAKEMAERALELDSSISEAYNALAMVAYSKADYDKAKNLYKQAIRLNPDNATAHVRLSWLLTRKENLDEAINEMRLAQKAKPKSQMINSNLASLLRLNRQTDEALNYCNKAIEIDPSNTWARVILAEIYEQRGQMDKSIKELKSVPKNAPEENIAKLLLSRVYAKSGKKKAARKILSEASKVKSKYQLPAYEVATIYAHLGENKEAVRKLQKAKDNSLIYFLHLRYDYNIDPLRDTPEYSKILSQSKDKISKTKDKNS